ncbi:MAG TPA: histidine phosphatase family protein [Oculatellaceae cyanobacterium]
MANYYQYLIVLRHGQTPPNMMIETPTDAHFYPVTGADTTIGMTVFGVEQVVEAAEFIVKFLGKLRLKRIFCSQFYRTRQTALLVQKALPYHPPVREDKRIAKRGYGDFWNITYAGVKALYPEEYAKFMEVGSYMYRPPGGENYPDLKVRLESFIADEIEGSDDNICISGHAAGVLMLEQMLLGELTNYELVERYDNIAVLNATVTVYRRLILPKVFGVRLAPPAWFRNLCGLNQRPAWKKVASFVPSASTRKVA